jgi:DNA-binding CsgD family transcriptional regulator
MVNPIRASLPAVALAKAGVYLVTVLKAVAVYGLAGGALIAALTFAEYRFLVVERSVEIYGGLIAAIFAALGIWLGLTLTRTRDVVVVKEVPAPDVPFAADAEKVRELGITPRELEILQLIARGLSTREIAAALFVSENTVKTHASRLFDKLGVNRRIKAVETARTLRLIPGHPNG